MKIIWAIFLCISAASAFAADRVALLICNGQYREPAQRVNDTLYLPQLDSPAADLALMEKTLTAAGFVCTRRADRTTAEMRADVQKFASENKGAPVVLFYYSGHGLAQDGVNYLAGVDALIDVSEKVGDLERARASGALSQEMLATALADIKRRKASEQLMPLDDVLTELGSMSSTRGHRKIVLLDACRDPFANSERERSLLAVKSVGVIGKGGAGLAKPAERPGMFIGFSAAAGQASIALPLDKSGKAQPSLFTRAFCAEALKPGVELSAAFYAAGETISDESQKLFEELRKEQRLAGVPAARLVAQVEQTPADYTILFPPGFIFIPEGKRKLLTLDGSTPFPSTPGIVPSAATPAPRMETAKLETPKLLATPTPVPPIPVAPELADEQTLAQAKIKLTAFQQQFKFSEASALAAAIQVFGEKGQTEREALLKKAEWLDKFKRTLIADITTIGYAAPIEKRNRATLPAGAHRATQDQIEVTTPFGNISAPWADISFDSIFAIAHSFLKYNFPPDRLADRQWYLGVFAVQMGKTQEGREFLTQASRAKGEYGDQLTRYFDMIPSSTLPSMAGATIAIASARKDLPFVNSLDMKFVPVAGTNLLFSIWDTRVQDYAEYARAKGITPEKPDFEQGPAHPAVNVSWEDAQAFCAWLSKKEGRTYRLPTDAEWGVAVGLGSADGNSFPWGTQWLPPPGAGNYADATAKRSKSGFGYIDGYDDGFAYTSPVGSFAANQNGLFDMGGNVWQWSEDWYDAKHEYRSLRGASWFNYVQVNLRSTYRRYARPAYRDTYTGFRCVLVISGG